MKILVNTDSSANRITVVIFEATMLAGGTLWQLHLKTVRQKII